MHDIIKILLSSAAAGIVCATIGFLVSFPALLLDSSANDALSYSLLAIVFFAIVGTIIGFIVAVSHVGPLSGGVVGLLAVVVIALMMHNQRAILLYIIITIPMVSAGVVAALTAKLLSRFL